MSSSAGPSTTFTAPSIDTSKDDTMDVQAFKDSIERACQTLAQQNVLRALMTRHYHSGTSGASQDFWHNELKLDTLCNAIATLPTAYGSPESGWEVPELTHENLTAIYKSATDVTRALDPDTRMQDAGQEGITHDEGDDKTRGTQGDHPPRKIAWHNPLSDTEYLEFEDPLGTEETYEPVKGKGKGKATVGAGSDFENLGRPEHHAVQDLSEDLTQTHCCLAWSELALKHGREFARLHQGFKTRNDDDSVALMKLHLYQMGIGQLTRQGVESRLEEAARFIGDNFISGTGTNSGSDKAGNGRQQLTDALRTLLEEPLCLPKDDFRGYFDLMEGLSKMYGDPHTIAQDTAVAQTGPSQLPHEYLSKWKQSMLTTMKGYPEDVERIVRKLKEFREAIDLLASQHLRADSSGGKATGSRSSARSRNFPLFGKSKSTGQKGVNGVATSWKLPSLGKKDGKAGLQSLTSRNGGMMLSQSKILDQMKKLPPDSRAARQAEFARKMCYDLEKGLVTETELSNIVNSLCRRVIVMSAKKEWTDTGSPGQQPKVHVGMASFAPLMNALVLKDPAKADVVSSLGNDFNTGQITGGELTRRLRGLQNASSGY